MLHKNFDILPSVLKELRSIGVDNVRFHVTIPSTNLLWKNIQADLKKCNMSNRVINHGRCLQPVLADMYRNCQLCFLPTLLEVFSATTLEAMYFRLPIIATDFDFNREVMKDSCLYYEPMNAKSAAMQIKRYVENEPLRELMKQEMDKRLELFKDYDKHFNDIVDFLKSCGNHNYHNNILNKKLTNAI